MFYIHKHEIAQAYGGPEEGNWYYKEGFPVPTNKHNPQNYVFGTEEAATHYCNVLNNAEQNRRKVENKYDYTSVLSYESTFYEYSVHETPVAEHFPEHKPVYE